MSKFGYYSAQAEASCGSFIYETPTGERVIVTGVGDTVAPKDSGYLWPDAKFVGEVLTFAGEHVDARAGQLWKLF